MDRGQKPIKLRWHPAQSWLIEKIRLEDEEAMRSFFNKLTRISARKPELRTLLEKS